MSSGCLHSTIQAPLNDLVASLVTAGTSLAQAVVALFHLVFAFEHFWFDKYVQFARTCIQLGFDLFRDVAGFVVGASGCTPERRRMLIYRFCSQLICTIASGSCRWVLLVDYSISCRQAEQGGHNAEIT
jgi:hypothetical protein